MVAGWEDALRAFSSLIWVQGRRIDSPLTVHEGRDAAITHPVVKKEAYIEKREFEGRVEVENGGVRVSREHRVRIAMLTSERVLYASIL